MKLLGLDGTQLWGFLASLGTLALLDRHASRADSERPRLRFHLDGVPELDIPETEDAVALTCFEELSLSKQFYDVNLADIGKPSDFTDASFRQLVTESDRLGSDIIAGLAVVLAEEPHETTLCAANGASHQNLVQSMRDVLSLLSVVGVDALRASLFVPWTKSFEVTPELRRELDLGSRKPTLRLDPADERLYALRLTNPTTANDFRTELGGQALAIPAFPLLPVVPRAAPERPVTVASRRASRRTFFSWPLWSLPCGLPTARSLIWAGTSPEKGLVERGVFGAYQVARTSGDKGKLSFGPSEGLW